VIARGELKAKVDLKVQAASASVVKAIEKAGGSFEKVPTPLRKSAKDIESDEK
jgi:ribosomal protein L18e/L15